MKVGLFIPCYIDLFYPRVAVATLELLRSLECTVEYPTNQTCCGQPVANAGGEQFLQGVTDHFAEVFAGYDHVVAPSGSCIYHVQQHGQQKSGLQVWELTDFLTTILKIDELPAVYPEKVVLHTGCHGLRGLELGVPSERAIYRFSPPRYLLELVEGLEIVTASRADECCGFGGTYSVTEPEVSVSMGEDRLKDWLASGARTVVSTDVSCLMHLAGLAKRKELPLQFLHISQVLYPKTQSTH